VEPLRTPDTTSDAPTSRRVALALGSGGARGYAHIGAIEVLEERGYQIVTVAGSSMGALVGGLHAAGKLDVYTEWALGLTQLDVLRLLDVSLSAPGVLRAEKIFARVRDLFDGVLIEDLPVPFTAVATDLFARKAVWFQQGPADVAVRASLAIPGLFAPVMLNGRLLVDGGVMDPVPIGPTAAVHADITIAVDLGGERSGQADGPPERETAAERPVDEWLDRFRRGASRLLDRDMVRSFTSRFGIASEDEQEAEPRPSGEAVEALPEGVSRFDLMNQSLEAMQSVLTRYRLAGNPPDVLVTVPKDACRSLDFHRAADMIELGRSLTTDALDAAGFGGRADSSSGPLTGPLDDARHHRVVDPRRVPGVERWGGVVLDHHLRGPSPDVVDEDLHEAQRHVDPRRHAGRGDDAPVEVLDDPLGDGLGAEARECVEHRPVGRGGQSVEQPRGAEDERPGADRGREPSRRVHRAHPVDDRTAVDEGTAADAAGDHDDVGVGNVGERGVDREAEEAIVGADDAALDADEDDVEVGHALEDLVGTDGVERGEPGEERDGDLHDGSSRELGVRRRRPQDAETGGQRSAQGWACSSWAATRSSRSSRP
jgi:NTE family protein